MAFLDIEEYAEKKDIEKEILSCFVLDEKYECISQTILQPKHFLNEMNRKMFIFLKNYYNKHKHLNIKEVLKEEDDIVKYISKCFIYAGSFYTGLDYFREDEERLIKKWQRVATEQLTQLLIKEKIDYKTFKIKLDEINQNQYFKNLLDIAEDIEDTTPTNTKEREYTSINQLDYLTKGLEYGSLNVFSGLTNSGKTTFMTQVAKNFVLNKKKVFYFNGEQTGKEFKNNLYVSLCTKEQIDFVKDKNNPRIIDVMPKKEILESLNNSLKDRLFVYNNNIPKNDIDTMILVMEEAFRKGVRIYFVDNFMQLDNSEQLDQQTRIVEKFKRFARDKNSIVILVAHPRKLNFGTTRLNIFDISGTQNISNKAANIFTIIRKDTMSENDKDIMTKHLLDNDYLIDDCDAIIEVLKTKGNKNGLVGLRYDKDLKVYKEVRRLTEEEKGRMDMEALKKRKRTN